ncbi:MAG: hypothetical protein JW715_16940, partial [Sedimentisphaerales bacterium]|nr:hypothetical protein [Sedimentisphaerales bacterium]
DNQNYKAEQILLDISGDINIAGVLLEGLPGMPITDENGRYSSRIPYGWGGTVTPIKEGLVMTPASRSYTAVAADQKNQDYFAEPLMLTITDVVKVNGQPVPGVKVTTNDGISSVTDTKGRYAIIVPYGWTGEIALHKEGYKFDPPSKPFANVVTNIRDGVSEQQSPFRARTSSRVRSIGAYSSSIGRTDNRRILVVPDGDVKSEELARMVEDMYVMSYILDERFKEPRMIRGVFRDFGDFFGRDNRQTEAVYMQGYGIVFMMEVDYTFTPAPQTPEQTAGEPNKEVDSTWQLAKERMFSPGTGSISRSGDGQEYEGQMVDELKADLVRTLKHASNIRNLAPNEWIVLSVTGTGSQSGVNVMGGWQVYGQSSSRMRAPSSSGRVGSYGGVRSSDGGGAAMGGYGGGGMMGGYGGAGMSGYGGSSMGGYGSSGMGGSAGGMMGGYGGGGMGGSAGGMMGGMGGYSEPNVSPSTVLTIRAMKADVDAFSEGELNFDEFRQRVQILMY